MESVAWSVDSEGVAYVTLNRPQKHNAFDARMIAQLDQALDQIAHRKSARVVVLAASGTTFSAGADLSWMQKTISLDYDGNLRDARQLASLLRKLNQLPLPVIAKVNGSAFGGAVGLLACCDVVVAVEAARFALSEVRLGLVPATISPYIVRAIGLRAARRYCLTGEQFDALSAKELGLVSQVVAADELDDVVKSYLGLLLQNGPEALAITKQLLRDVGGSISEDVVEKTSQLIARIRVSKEAQEGVQAFLQKRKPNWRKK